MPWKPDLEHDSQGRKLEPGLHVAYNLSGEVVPGVIERITDKHIEVRCLHSKHSTNRVSKVGQGKNLLVTGGRLIEILVALVGGEDSPCSFDHHGYCQEHGWFGDPGECGIREARKLLGLDKKTGTG